MLFGNIEINFMLSGWVSLEIKYLFKIFKNTRKKVSAFIKYQYYVLF